MTNTRRHLLKHGSAFGLFSAWTLSGGVNSALAQPRLRQRKDIAGLTAGSQEIAELTRGIELLQANGASHPHSWEKQREIHATRAMHWNWWFLPWHRIQLYYLEKIIGKLIGNPNFALPYWDFRTAPTIPEFMWSGALNDPDASRRRRKNFDYRNANARDNFGSTFLLDDNGAPVDPWNLIGGNWQGAAGTIEGTGHNWVHDTVNGNLGSTTTATLDPLFWLHHCNVDRVWEKVLRQHTQITNGVPNNRSLDRRRRPVDNDAWLDEDFAKRGMRQLPGNWRPSLVNDFNELPFVDENMMPATKRVRDVLFAERLGYEYDQLFPGTTFEALAPNARRRGEKLREFRVFAETAASIRATTPASFAFRLDEETRRGLSQVSFNEIVQAILILPCKFKRLQSAALVGSSALGAVESDADLIDPQVKNGFALAMVSNMTEDGAYLSYDTSVAVNDLVDLPDERTLSFVLEAKPVIDDENVIVDGTVSGAELIIEIYATA